MIDQATLITYLAVLLGFVFLPGPATLLTLARASASGTRAGLATATGIAAGDILHTLMAVVGISAIVLASATLFSIVKYLGAAYLVYLGLTAILGKDRQTAMMTGNAAGAAVPLPFKKAFRQAVLTEVLNPKSAMFFLAFLPQFVKPENGAVSLQLLILGVLFVLMGLVSLIVVAVAAGKVGGFLRRNPAVVRWQGKVVGGIYCGLGVRLALQER